MTALAGCSRGESPEPTLNAFLEGWRTGNLEQVGFVTPEGEAVAAGTVTEEITSLTGELDKKPNLSVSQRPKVTKDLAKAEITVSWPLGQDVTWQYPSPVQLSRDQGKWRMVWTPSVVHPQLTSGDQLAQQRKAAPRGAILDAAGEAIVKPRPVVVVGIEPRRVTNITQLMADLDRAFKSVPVAVDLSGVPAKVAGAKPDAFIEVVTLREEAYARIRPQIEPLPGTVFRREMWELAPTREFAAALLGGVGAVTKEILDANPGKYQVGDQVGLGGLQRRYDDRLRGTPGVTVIFKRTAADSSVKTVELWSQPAKPGTSLRTTLDQRIQTAADNALKTQPKNSAIVAMKISDGTVVGLANGGPNGANNMALTAQVPPGSTFKMVSTVGLLDKGAVSLDGVVPCPKTFTVDGATFKNAHDFVLGNVPFRIDFSQSCNTAFASLAPQLGDNGLADAARTVGIGVPWDLGLDAFSGKVSAGGSKAERAAATFGQGTTIVSPVAMAAAVAAIVRGQWQQPKLLLEPGPASPAPGGPMLKTSTVEPLRTMMREVVTNPSGTGRGLAGTPGGPVAGKTGTAEFEGTNSHAWFIGWQGDIAFAVFIENGGSSTSTAVPLADRFLRNLAGA